MIMIERMIQYFKDRTEFFDDYYPCNSKKKNVIYRKNTIGSSYFVYLYNAKIKNTILFKIGGEIT